MTDVLFVNPLIDKMEGVGFSGDDPDSINVGLCCLASSLKEVGFKTKIIDMYADGYKIEEVIKYIKDNKPKIIGIHSTSLGLRKLYSFIRYLHSLKQNGYEFKIIVGGPHISAEPNIIRELGIEYGMIGDSDISIVKFCKNMIHGQYYDKIEGLVRWEGEEIKIESQKWLESLDILPRCDYNLFLRKKTTWYRILLDGVRGCVFNCSFCPTPLLRGRKIMYRHYKKVVNDMKEIVFKYQPKLMEFTAESFTFNTEWVVRFCEEKISEKVKVKWGCLSSLDDITEEIILKMAEANCAILSFGIESGNDEIRMSIGKKLKRDIQKYKEMLSLCRKIKIATTFYFIIGLPSEKCMEFQSEENIKFCKYVRPTHPHCAPYHIMPGSKLYFELIKSGEIKDSVWREFMYGGNVPVYIPLGYTISDLKRLQVKFYRKCYLNISSFVNVLRDRGIIKLQFTILIISIWKELLEPIAYRIANVLKFKR